MIIIIIFVVLKINESDEDGGNYSIIVCIFIKYKKIDNLIYF